MYFLCFLFLKFLEVEVALAASDVLDVLGGDVAHALIGHLGQFPLNQSIALGHGVFAGKVHEVLLERHQRIGRADVANLAGFAQCHEAVARAARTVAGGAEAGQIADGQEPVDDLVEGARVAHVELGSLIVALYGGVTAHAGAAAAADLTARPGAPGAAPGSSPGAREALRYSRHRQAWLWPAWPPPA